MPFPRVIVPKLVPQHTYWAQTTRVQGASTGPYSSFNLASHVGDNPAAIEGNWTSFGESLPFTRTTLATANQVHGDAICWVTRGGHHEVDADAIVSTKAGIAVGVYTADCVPVLVSYPEHGVVAAIHCGWRGAAANLIEKLFSAVQQRCGASPHSAFVWLGASIAQCNYQVGEEVVDACLGTLKSDERQERGSALSVPDRVQDKYLLDVAEVVHSQLKAAGVLTDRLERCDLDTFAEKALLYSYRRDGASTGRMLSFVGLKTS